MRDRSKNAHVAHVAHVLYAALIGGKHHLPTVARLSGIAAACLYDACENKRDLPAHWLPRIFAATQDVELYARLSGIVDAGLVLSERPRSANADTALLASLRVGSSAGRAQLAVVEAAEDGAITDDERRVIESRLDELEREAERLRHTLRAATTESA